MHLVGRLSTGQKRELNSAVGSHAFFNLFQALTFVEAANIAVVKVGQSASDSGFAYVDVVQRVTLVIKHAPAIDMEQAHPRFEPAHE